MNPKSAGWLMALNLIAASAVADHHQSDDHHIDEEIVVSAPFQKSSAETALPIGILSGEQLHRQVANNLGESLTQQLGVHNSSFGNGVGLPVIRGQSGSRVQVLQNSTNTSDVSTLSPDHANGVEPILAERLEVIRGPSTLLYGNGAIGGVINVIDGRIPERKFETMELIIEQNHSTASDENKTLFKLNTGIGALNLHIDYFDRDNDDVEIDGFAIDVAALEAEEEHHEEEEEHEEEGHEDEEHHEDEIVNTKGYIGNSDAEADGYTVGLSFVGDRGFIGFSVNELDHNYGLPAGTHAHHEDEHHDEDEDHDEEGEDHEEEGEDHEEGQEFVRIDLEQARYDLAGEYRFEGSFFERITASVNYTDYEHRELEIEADGGTHVGTHFKNEGYESRFTVSHAPINNWSGVWGMQLSETEFSAVGEEAFIPETDKNSYSVFGVERYDGAATTWELGLRLESTDLDPEIPCNEDETALSVSASMLHDLSDETNLLVGISRSERTPTIEERYSNIESTCSALPLNRLVVHAATGLAEIGNPDLDKETATNIELGIRKHVGAVTGELSVYYNKIDDYIFLQETGEEVDEADVATYLANDAKFIGFEGRLIVPLLENDHGNLDLSLQGDWVRADFDDGGNVPRIPPARFGATFAWYANNWSFDLGLTRVFEQDDTAEGESSTDGYTLLTAYADYHWELGGQTELRLFARGTNLLDEEIRNHTSLLKNFAPEAGRGVRFGIRLTY